MLTEYQNLVKNEIRCRFLISYLDWMQGRSAGQVRRAVKAQLNAVMRGVLVDLWTLCNMRLMAVSRAKLVCHRIQHSLKNS